MPAISSQPAQASRKAADQEGEDRDRLLGVDAEEMGDAKVAAAAVPAEQGDMAAFDADRMAVVAARISAPRPPPSRKVSTRPIATAATKSRLRPGRRPPGDLPGERQRGRDQQDRGEAHQAEHDLVEQSVAG